MERVLFRHRSFFFDLRWRETMKSTWIVIAWVCLTPLICSPVRAEDDPILGKAGNYVFKKSDFERLIRYSPPALQKQIQENPQYIAALVRRILEQKSVSDWARKEGFDREPEVKEQIQYLVDDFLMKEYLMKKVMKDVSVSEDDVKRYYNENEAKYTTPLQVRVRHMLIKVPFGSSSEEKKKAREKAEGILGWLKKGERFEKLAEAYSEDLDSKAKGGELGYFSRGRMPKAFEDTAFSMKPGQVSEPIETDYGYHIIEVQDRKEARTIPLEEVKESIRKQLTDEMTRKKVDEFIKKVAQETGLEVYSDKILEENKK